MHLPILIILAVASLIIGSKPLLADEHSYDVAVGAYVMPGIPTAHLFYEFADTMAERSENRLVPKMLIHGEGGSEEQVLASLRRGRIQLAAFSFLSLATLIPEIEITKAPFLFDSVEEYDFVLDAHLAKEIDELLAAKNLVRMRWLNLGPTHLYGKKSLANPHDIRGYRVRASSDLATQVFLEAVNADIIFMPTPDIVPALQTGLLDGGATPAITYAQTGYAENARHYTLTGHFYLGSMFVADKKWLDELPLELRNIVMSSYASDEEIRTVYRRLATAQIARSKIDGFHVYKISQEQLSAWKSLVAGTHEIMIAAIGGRSQEFYDKILEGKRAFALKSGPSNGLAP